MNYPYYNPKDSDSGLGRNDSNGVDCPAIAGSTPPKLPITNYQLPPLTIDY
jgi:hypothetical protein